MSNPLWRMPYGCILVSSAELNINGCPGQVEVPSGQVNVVNYLSSREPLFGVPSHGIQYTVTSDFTIWTNKIWR